MIEFRDFSFRYEESSAFTLNLLTGKSGYGKTTLIRSLNGFIPHFYPGEMKGELLLNGNPY